VVGKDDLQKIINNFFFKKITTWDIGKIPRRSFGNEAREQYELGPSQTVTVDDTATGNKHVEKNTAETQPQPRTRLTALHRELYRAGWQLLSTVSTARTTSHYHSQNRPALAQPTPLHPTTTNRYHVL